MVLVTGGTGFIGAHLLLHLVENGEKVRSMYRNEKSLSKTKRFFSLHAKDRLFETIEWLEADITNIPQLEIAFADVTQVYHCAALVSFDPKDEEKLRKTNIEGTANVVNLALRNSVEKFCHVSSIAALGDLPEHETIVTETTEWNPEKFHSDYAISKYGGEMEVWRAQQEGLNVLVVNPGVVLGSGFFGSSSGELFSAISKGMRFYTKGTTGFVGVEDVVKIMRLLMQKSIDGERFIIVSENISYEKIIKSIAENLQVKSPKWHAKKWLTSIAWRWDWIASNVFFAKRKLPKSMAKSIHTTDLYSNGKIKKTLNFEFVPINEVVKTTAENYKKENLI